MDPKIENTFTGTVLEESLVPDCACTAQFVKSRVEEEKKKKKRTKKKQKKEGKEAEEEEKESSQGLLSCCQRQCRKFVSKGGGNITAHNQTCFWQSFRVAIFLKTANSFSATR